MKVTFEGGSIEAAIDLAKRRKSSRSQIVTTRDSKQFQRNFGDGRGVDDGPPKEKSRPGKGGSRELVVRPASNTPATDTRQQHVEAVTAALAAIANAECSRVESYIIAGEALVAAKAAGAHGTWRGWIDQYFPQSSDTA